jgi:diacylglycerol kinase (ATP)
MKMNSTTTIIVNPYCHQGKGWDRWKEVRDIITARIPDAYSLVLEKGVSLSTTLDHLLSCGPSYLISAGGDGTVHHLINTLIKYHPEQLKQVTLGAIGLGSSNDFIKPAKSAIRNIPVRIDNSRLVDHDLGKIEFIDPSGAMKTEYFIINTSIGVTAFGNWVFNHPGRWLSFLKKWSTPLAIMHTALRSLFQSRNISCRIEWDDHPILKEVTNLNILKLPYVSGSFRYDQQIEPDDGTLLMNICHDMGIFRKIQALYLLGNGRLSACRDVISERIRQVQISTGNPMLLECDGETFQATNISISLLSKAIKVVKN